MQNGTVRRFMRGSLNRFQAKVVRRVMDASDVVTLYFTVNDKSLDYVPGQYITVYFDDTDIKQGKAYSLSNYVADLESSITVKKVGLFSSKLFNLQVGDTFLISQAYGFFNISSDRPIVALAAGIGISPIWSIIRNECSKDKKRSIKLLYSNKTYRDTVFYSDICRLASCKNNFSVRYFVTREINPDAISRRIDIKKDLSINDLLESTFYVCGSVDFVRSMWRQLVKFGADENNISTETFF